MDLMLTDEKGWLRATVSGEFRLDEANRVFLTILEGVARRRVDKILFDGRGVTGKLAFMDRYQFAQHAADASLRYAKQRAERAPQFAFVMHEPILDRERFGEAVAANRGMLVRAFDNLDAALDWLGVVAVR